jgi:hypothetical protein
MKIENFLLIKNNIFASKQYYKIKTTSFYHSNVLLLTEKFSLTLLSEEMNLIFSRFHFLFRHILSECTFLTPIDKCQLMTSQYLKFFQPLPIFDKGTQGYLKLSFSGLVLLETTFSIWRSKLYYTT